MANFVPQDHTFAICAYKENPFLEDCIQSLLGQTTPSNIILSTSTPNAYIAGMAEKYGLQVVVNTGETGLFQDFNAACVAVKTKLVTICHQDDLYAPAYLEESLKLTNQSEKPLILFTNYSELRGDDVVENNTLLRIKSLMNSPLRLKSLWGSKWMRRRILSLGSPICCPSVMFNKEAVGERPFFTGYSNSGDWKTWSDLAKHDGDFIYCPQKLMTHRIWAGSETTRLIENRERNREDFEIFCEFWPRWMARLILKVYSMAEKSNG